MATALEKIKKYKQTELEKKNTTNNTFIGAINSQSSGMSALEKIEKYKSQREQDKPLSTEHNNDMVLSTPLVTPYEGSNKKNISTNYTLPINTLKNNTLQKNYDINTIRNANGLPSIDVDEEVFDIEEFRKNNADKIIVDNRTTKEKLKDYSLELLTTPWNALVETGKGVLDFVEGVGDTMLQLGSSKINPYYWFNPDKLESHQKTAAELIAKDSSQSFIDDTLGYGDVLSTGKTVQETIDEHSLVKSDNELGQVFRSVGSQLPSMMIGGAGAGKAGTIGSSVSFGTNTYGNAIGDAYTKGADRDTANLYGFTQATIELATERLYGGLGSVLKTGAIDDVLAKQVSKKLGNTLTSKMVQMGIGAFAEGGEEVASELLNQAVKKLSELNGGELQKLIDDPNYYDSFVSGVLSSLVIGGAQLATNNNPNNIEQINSNNNISNNSTISNENVQNNTNIRTDEISVENDLNNIKNNSVASDDLTLSFSEQVDNVINGTFPQRDMLLVSKNTPQVLQDIGLNDLPITITQKHLNTIMNSDGQYKGANYHDLGIDIVKQLPRAIAEPLNVLKSNTKDDSIVVITDLADNQERPVIASIKIDGKGQINDIQIDTNVMTSAYGRNNYEKFMEENIAKGNLLYDIDEGIIKKSDATDRVQFPVRSSSNNIASDIPKNTSPISYNNNTTNLTTSQIEPLSSQYIMHQNTKNDTPNGITLPKASEIQNTDKVENTPKLLKAKKEIPQDPTKESSYDNNTKKTRKQVSFELLNEMGISEQDIAKGNDISAIDLSRTDPIRVNEKIFGAKIGQKINDATINKTKHNEAERTRWLNKERDEIKSLGIKAQSKESAAVQKYGEKQYITRNNEVIPYSDVQLAKDFPDVETQNKIKKAAQIIRNKYDNYIEQINEVLVDMGYNPIKKRPDYMRHFQALNDVFSRFGTPLNAESMQNDSLPTDINGLTDQFKPGKQYFANAMQRMGLKTEYDAITGIDGYLEGASNLIFHTEDIQRYRTLSKLIRDTYGSKNGYEDFANMSEKEQEQRIADIQSNKLAKYAAWLDEQANALAGKKGKIDRGAEELFGRKVYTVLQTAKKQVGSNMTGYNVRSALTNFASAIQGASKINKLSFLKGTMSTINNIVHKDGLIDKSDFLTNRFGSDSLSPKLWQKMSNAGQIFMKGSDYFTANQVWRGKYFENLSNGMSESEAIKKADDFASRVMGDRSKGSTATIFNSNTLGFLTQFQLEVNNQWSSLIHDNKMDVQRGNKTGASVVFQLGQLFAMSYLFNNMMKSLTGSDVMIDPIDLLKKIFNPDDDEKTLEERTTEVLGEVVNNIPFASIFTGGRIPISEAFDGVSTGFKFATGQTDEYGNKYTLSDVRNDIIESAFYWLLPTGYGQIKKTIKGASMYSGKLPTAGSYTDSGNLRFTADESIGGKTKALLFGQYSSEEAQDYIDSGFKAISKNHIQEMKDLGMTSTEYRKYRTGLSNAGTKNSEKLDYINSLDVSIEQKNIMANNVIDSDKYTVDMSNYNDYGSYEAMRYALQYPTNYSIIKSITNYDNYSSYRDKVNEIKEQYEGDEKSTIRKQKVFQYVNSLPYSRVEKIILFNMLGNYGISDYKNEVFNYINDLDISKSEKEQMWKQIYGK